AEAHLPGQRAADAEERLGERGLADPDKPGHGDHLAGRERKAEWPRAGSDLKVFGCENRAGPLFYGDRCAAYRAAKHGLHRAFVVERLVLEDTCDRAVAQADDPIGHAADIRHAMRYVEDGDATVAQPVDELEEP